MDRFEQMVEQAGKATGYTALNEHGRKFGMLLLRRQHAAYVRMVKKIKSKHFQTYARQGVKTWRLLKAFDELLTALAQYKKGTP